MNPDKSNRSGWRLIPLAGLAALLAALVLWRMPRPQTAEEFARLSNAGKSALEAGQAREALTAFEKALALDPTQPDAEFNVALALLQSGQNDAAARRAQALVERDKNLAAAWYVLGLAHLHAGRFEQAVQALTQAKNIDVTVNAVAFQLGLAYEGWGKVEEAINEWQTMVQFEPDHPAAQYRLSQALRRAGRAAEADAALQAHQQALASRPGQLTTPAALEKCQYTAARVPIRVAPPSPTGVQVVFTDTTAAALPEAGRFRGPPGAIDFAQDGRNHLLALETGGSFRLLLNSNGVFRAQGEPRPGVPGARYTRCLVADLNNDGAPDALFLGDKGVKLFKFSTNGAMTDATLFAGLGKVGAVEGALLDLDYRGSLDLVTVSPENLGVRVLRNLGNLYFSDCTATSGVPAALTGVRQLAVEDWNNDDVQDLLLARDGAAPLLLAKQRGGPLVPTNSPADWPAARLLAAGDLNNDLLPDVAAATASAIEIVFAGNPKRVNLAAVGLEPTTLRLVDYDNDGWLDIVAAGKGARAWRNLGPAGFRETTAALQLDRLGPEPVDGLAAADFDLDGDTDFVLSGPSGLRHLRNDGGNANLQLKLHLLGRRSNGSGLGIRIELASADLRLARRVQSLPVEIGVGRHSQLDSVNARWFNTSPSYVDVKVDPHAPLLLEELNIQEGSCPYLYAWDGQRFRFVTDILGAAPLGLPVAENRYVEADTTEIVWLGDDRRLRPRDGRYLLQVTEELREVLYLDHARLLVADHPPDTEVHSTSKLRPGKPYPPHELMSLHRRQPLRKATRGTGEDMTSLVAEADGRLASPPELRGLHLRGLAAPHDYVLDFGPLDPARPWVLALTGWLRLGGGMANIAASHHPDLPFPFPVLEAEGPDGHWQILEGVVGAPSGKTKTILTDLSGRLPFAACRLRLSAAYELHWDRIALFEKTDPGLTRIRELLPEEAHLHWRGFSRMADLPWNQPFTPVYEQVSATTVFDFLPGGWCTRYGPALELVAARDNALALINGGDELTLAFPASQLPPAAPGLARDFFLLSCGWDKDTDFHVRLGATVEPLPWHGMDDQRYGSESRPALANDDWIRKYNTRWVGPRFLSRKK